MVNRIIASLILIVLFTETNTAWASGECGKQEISPVELDLILREGGGEDYLPLDMRSSKLFLTGTIAGATNIGKIPDILAHDTHQDVDNRSVVIVTENGFPDDSLGEWIAQLCEKGTDVWILQGGVLDWKAAGLMLENPTDRLTLPGAVPFLVPRGLCELNAPVQNYN